MDIMKMIGSAMPDGALDGIASQVGIDADSVTGILKEAAPSVLSATAKNIDSDESFLDSALAKVSDGGLASILLGSKLESVIEPIAKKFGINSTVVSSVIDKALPFVLEQIKSGKISTDMLTAAAGLADGVDMEDVQNIAGAVLSKKKAGIMGMLAGLLGKK